MEAGMKLAFVAVAGTIAKIAALAHPLPPYTTHETLEGIQCIKELKFENAEQTINNKPNTTFFPRTVEDISRIIKYAKEEGKRVRVAGMKHSWTDLFSDDGEFLISLLPLEVTDHLTFGRIGMGGLKKELQDWKSNLNKIQV